MKRGLLTCMLGLALTAQAQTYPGKPIRFSMPYPPDGGTTIVGSTPAQLDAHVRSEIARWTKVVKDSGAKIE